MKILIIEDEKDLSKSIYDYLSGEDYLCEQAANIKEALNKTDVYDYDCILLDIGLPDGSGMKILEELRLDKKQDGVIIISAKNSLDDKIQGLNIGADDYLTKPFNLAELMARINSVIRRRQFESSNLITQDELRIDLNAKRVTVNDKEVMLTPKEFDLLVYFIGNKNRVISKTSLAEHLSGEYADMLDSFDFVYTHVKNLKKKLHDAGCPAYLTTVYGTGYRWEY